MSEKPTYHQRVYQVVNRIPFGRVCTYGRIAKIAGRMNARMVGYALAALPDGTETPWHRVINREGRLSLRSDGRESIIQRKSLEAEGIVFDASGKVDLARYLWSEEAPPEEVMENRHY